MLATNFGATNSTTGTYNPVIATKRKERDIMRLLMSDYKVVQSPENPYDFNVEFHGPKDTPYEGGLWNVHVLLPEQYPYKSPSIGFVNKIYHPNIHEASGSVCLDVINQTWSPMFDLVNIFEVFLPQLLSYPNPASPLNPEAAAQLMKEPEKYKERIRDYVLKYAMTGKRSSHLSSQMQLEQENHNPNVMVPENAAEGSYGKENRPRQPSLDQQKTGTTIEMEEEDDKISMGNVSALSEVSDVNLIEEC